MYLLYLKMYVSFISVIVYLFLSFPLISGVYHNSIVLSLCRYDRIIVSRDGPDENVIKVKPPLVFSKENVDLLVDGLAHALDSAISLNVF